MSIEKRLSAKLYDPRNLEGVPDSTMFEAVRRFEEVFKDYSGFIGVSPFGSSTKGYSVQDSDIDMRIFIDSQETARAPFENKAREIEHDLETETGKPVHAYVRVIHKDALIENIQSLCREYEYAPDDVAELFRIIKGKKVREYRNIAIEEIRKLDKTDQEDLIKRMAQALTRHELASKYKIEDRTGEKLDEAKLTERRTTLWEKRIWSLIQG